MGNDKKWFVARRGCEDHLIYLFTADTISEVKSKAGILFAPTDIRSATWADVCSLLGAGQPHGVLPSKLLSGSILIPGSGITDVCLWPL